MSQTHYQDRLVFEAEASGGSKAGGLPTLLFPFPSPPLSIPPKFSDKPVGGKVRSSDGDVPRLPPAHYLHRLEKLISTAAWRVMSSITERDG